MICPLQKNNFKVPRNRVPKNVSDSSTISLAYLQDPSVKAAWENNGNAVISNRPQPIHTMCKLCSSTGDMGKVTITHTQHTVAQS